MSETQTLTGRIRALMTDGKPRTAAEVAVLFNARVKLARDVLSHMVATGQAHVCGHVGANHARVFRFGPGENAPLPLLDSEKARHKRGNVARWREAHHAAVDPWHEPKQRYSDEELDRRYRCTGAWWPKADPVVVNAMRALVRGGAQ
ncbi:hypothetical protein [Paraburkholderia adhaesiva]|uniref:hypothetical protein n=1 Tax=Paraburkholderia adhaesiva TaxID=2883244 RepID=UPI001F2A7D3B|nr:hypothetical protein [Paraburkholderia adhaesiva]